ncbi:right-handed parallel beta-helix repeat-containing protein [Echinicola jeungdonensis]|uniref:Right-handed parallel beta-helix repeat-containing protein n=1 Tax=Echinicola jeungdonensis TaxID=709343 RepID=A0ABV5J326_9BACT|nr:right-handed parallel beta-helix repeat-containing protein [Echinicola jeungdonensis]MDN3668111.1 right-handed parallel beta-helix repeat-containing protein [Echinicola jeungdonensis]
MWPLFYLSFLLVCCTSTEGGRVSGNSDSKEIDLDTSEGGRAISICQGQNQKNVVVFISPKGTDSYPGTSLQPLRSIKEAIRRVGKSRTNVTLFLREGVYQSAGLVLNQQNLDLQSLTISNFEREKVVISGGFPLEATSFKKYKSGSNIYYLNLPEGLNGEIGEISRINSTGFYETKNPLAMELFFNDEPMQLARHPNNKLISIDRVISSDPQNLREESVFYFDPNVKLNWKVIDEVRIGGQFSVGWINNNFKVKDLDLVSNKLVTSKTPYHGIYATNDTTTEVLKSSRNLRGFYFFNVYEALDTKGEWFYDKDKEQIFLIPPGNLKRATLSLSVLGSPFMRIENSDVPITIKGLNFTTTRGRGVELVDSKNITISNSTFRNIGLEGIKTENCENLKIDSCKISNTGAEGIYLSGGERKNLIPSNNSVTNCVINDFSRVFRSYSPGIRIVGVGHLISNNHLYGAPGQAIIFSGNDHVIEDNLIEDVCNEFTDMGGVYSGNDPSSTGTIIKGNIFNGINNPKSNMIASIYIDDGNSGLIIEDNIFIESGSPLFGAITINGGAFNQLKNNTFINCGKAYYAKYWSNQTVKNRFFDSPENYKKFTEIVDIRSTKFVEKYPHLVDFMNFEKVERKNHISGTRLYNVRYFGMGEGFKTEERQETVTKSKMDQATLERLNRWKIKL